MIDLETFGTLNMLARHMVTYAMMLAELSIQLHLKDEHDIARRVSNIGLTCCVVAGNIDLYLSYQEDLMCRRLIRAIFEKVR